MTPSQKALIRASFDTLAADVDASAALFYNRIFEKEPSLRGMFTVSIARQGRKFMDMMTSLLGCLDRMDRLVPMVWQMGKRHAGYGVVDAHYAVVGEALLWTLDRRAEGGSLSEETREAWTELYGLIARAMQQAAGEGGKPTRDTGP